MVSCSTASSAPHDGELEDEADQEAHHGGGCRETDAPAGQHEREKREEHGDLDRPAERSSAS